MEVNAAQHAALNAPGRLPAKVGEKYTLDGEELEWDFDTVAKLARKLTIDKNGNDATSPDFDPKNVTQFGFYDQWTDARGVAVLFGGGIPYDETTGSAVIPESYVDAWKWYYDGVWNKHFMPTADYYNSDQFNKGNVFPSGNLWAACCSSFLCSC